MQVKRWLVLPFFILKLGFMVTPTVLKLTVSDLSHQLPVLASAIFLGVVLILNAQKSPHHLPRPFFALPSPTEPAPTLSHQQIDQEIVRWEHLLSLQPTHRDLLLNLALLYQAKGDSERSLTYYNLAKKIDPNHPLFSDK